MMYAMAACLATLEAELAKPDVTMASCVEAALSASRETIADEPASGQDAWAAASKLVDCARRVAAQAIDLGVVHRLPTPGSVLHLRDNQLPGIFMCPIALSSPYPYPVSRQLARDTGLVAFRILDPEGGEGTQLWRNASMCALTRGFTALEPPPRNSRGWSIFDPLDRFLRHGAFASRGVVQILGVVSAVDSATIEVLPLIMWE